MKSGSEKYNRRSIRLSGYDYSKPGYYFVTICTHGRRLLLGNVNEDIMKLNPAGQMIDQEWNRILERYPLVRLHEYIIMPNHLHGIVQLMDGTVVVGTPLVGVRGEFSANGHFAGGKRKNDSTENMGGMQTRMGTRPIPTTPALSDIIGAFKSITTNQYIRNVKQHHWPRFKKRFWQQRFYDRIIRNENELDKIRNYIINNPQQWELDKNNPKNMKDIE